MAVRGIGNRDHSEPPLHSPRLLLSVRVAAGIGVPFAPSCIRSLQQPGVAFISIEPNPPPLELVAARLKAEPSPAVAAFLDMLRDQAEGTSARLCTAFECFC
jgi:DNA-binding transcriptional LysR family regulator